MAKKLEKTAIFAGSVDNFRFPASSLVENENVNKRADWWRTKSRLVANTIIVCMRSYITI